MPDIRLDRLTRMFGAVAAVNDVSMVFPEGSVTCLLGPSGCGKTTLMRMIAGLERSSSGRIWFGDRDVTQLSARERRVAMVFQYPVMYRTLSVSENIALPLSRDRRLNAAERRRRVDEVLEVLDLADRRDAHLGDLDMGSRQKVAVGRAIARHCDVILFDEPTTNVEVHAKLALIRAFKAFRSSLRSTIVYVTHDQTEAMTLADEIALMQLGVVSQCAAPRALYDEPDTEFGGWFLGSPGMNFYETPQGRAGIRPEYVRLYNKPGPKRVAARVTSGFITIGGQHLLTLVMTEAMFGTEIKAKIGPGSGFAKGSDVWLECPPEHVIHFHEGRRVAAPVPPDSHARPTPSPWSGPS